MGEYNKYIAGRSCMLLDIIFRTLPRKNVNRMNFI